MKHVVVTGGAGFIGSHLCEALLARGYAVTAVDNLLTGRERNLEDARKNGNFRFFRHDVTKPFGRAELELARQHGISGVMHLACPASPEDFKKLAFEILAVDSVGTMNTVNLALESGARYLLASTSEIYGDPLVHPQKEDYFGNVSTTGPRACYDETKRFAEAYVSTAVRVKNLNGAIARIFNTYGPRMRPDDGRVVPELCMQAIQGKSMTLHGDGMQTRSFCFVSDLVDGLVRLFESKETSPVNLGNPVEKSIAEFAETIKRLTGSRSPISHTPARPDDPRKRRPDISRARSVLGWEPRVDLEEGLRRTIEAFRCV